MNELNLHGVYTALITPFKDDLSVDFDALLSIVEKQVNSGVDGLVVLGSTAEAQTLSMTEKIAVMLKVQEQVNGRIPIIVGTGSNDTKASIEFTMVAYEYHFEGVLLVVPYYNKPSQEGIYQHYLAISESVDMPQIVYNVPSRTSTILEVDTYLKICEECKNVVGIKEASGDFEQIMDFIRHTPDGVSFMSGDDSLAVPAVLMGANGVISVLSNYAPTIFSECVHYAEQGKLQDAIKLHYELFDLFKLNFIETNPVPVKAIMKELELIENNLVRLPLVMIQESNLQLIRMMLKNRSIK
jgi:4-hydroxy-tetrahydrodipicolinate synthase